MVSNGRGPSPEGYPTPMEGQSAYYGVDIEEAAAILQLTPERVREMLVAGELEGIPPGATAQGDWKVLLPATPNLEQPAPADEPPESSSPEEQEETPPSDEDEDSEEPVEMPETTTEVEESLAATEEVSRGDDADTAPETTAPSGWVSTHQAARALGISPRTVRWHIEQGNLAAKPEGEGVRRSWLVNIDSLQAFRDTRQDAGRMPRGRRAPAEGSEIAAESAGNAVRELADRLAEEAARAAEYRVRLELTEQAASTVRAELEEERHRREEAERERDELRRRLEARPEPPGAPSEAAAEPERAEPLSGSPGPQERVSRPWWRRMFGG
jgi:hypothetical protein